MILGIDTFADELNERLPISKKYMLYLSNAKISEFKIVNDVDIVPSFDNYNKSQNSTIVNAKFENSLDYGENPSDVNLGSLYPIKYLYVQRKRDDETDFSTIYKVSYEGDVVGKVLDVYDIYVESGHTYFYRLIPIVYNKDIYEFIYGVASNTISVKVESFGNYLIDANGEQYEFLYDANIGAIKHNNLQTYVETLSSQYPFILSNGYTSYDTGSFKCTLVLSENSKYGSFDVVEEKINREKLYSWLTNGSNKILKTEDGLFKLISIDSGVTLTPKNSIIGLYELSFNYTEIGNPRDINSLQECGMLSDGVDNK